MFPLSASESYYRDCSKPCEEPEAESGEEQQLLECTRHHADAHPERVCDQCRPRHAAAVQVIEPEERREEEAVARGPIYVSHFPLSVLPRHSTNPYSAIDVHAPCRGKAEALRFLAETRGIPPERVIAVGDADNDIPMLREAGLGVAMGNALPEVHAEADEVIEDHRGDAIARLIEERLLP